MKPNFNRVVIRVINNDGSTGSYEGNIHLAVHPFKCEHFFMMGCKGYYDVSMPLWQRDLADKLWDEVPGMHTLFFGNGYITVQHHEVFTNAEIIEVAEALIRPVLEAQLKSAALPDVFSAAFTEDLEP